MRAAYYISGEDLYALFSSAAKDLCEVFPRLKTVRQKRKPDLIGKLGFCTYNAFYDDVSDQKIYGVLTALKRWDIRCGFLIVDSGWMREKNGKMRAFAPDENKFRGGFKEFTANLKADFSVEKVCVWHTFYGFWEGIDETLGIPVSRQIFNEENVCSQIKEADYIGGINTAGEDFYPMNITGHLCYLPTGENISLFYRLFYGYLQENGIEATKIDAISWLELFGEGPDGRAQIMGKYIHAAEKWGEEFLNGNILCCSGESTNFLFDSGDLALIRVCKDYIPEDLSTYGPHIYYAAMNSLWLGEFFYCDYDMFQSGGAGGRMHAISRAISGGPIYCSDNLNTLGFQVLRSLAAGDGSVPVCDSYARPTARSLFVNIFTEEKLFMQFNRLGDRFLLAAYNCSQKDSGKKMRIIFPFPRYLIRKNAMRRALQYIPRNAVFWGYFTGMIALRQSWAFCRVNCFPCFRLTAIGLHG